MAGAHGAPGPRHDKEHGGTDVPPFTAPLEVVLKAQKAEHDEMKTAGRIVPLVFHREGDRIKSLRGAWKAARKAAGVPGRILHDFRRTAVRNLERDGVSRSAAMAMAGHKTEAIYRRYAIVDAGALRDAAAKIERAARTVSGTVSAIEPIRRSADAAK